MTKKIKISELKAFDMAEHLDSEQAIAEYITIAVSYTHLDVYKRQA